MNNFVPSPVSVKSSVYSGACTFKISEFGSAVVEAFLCISKSSSGKGTDEPSETADTENRVICCYGFSHFGSSSLIPWPEHPLVVGI